MTDDAIFRDITLTLAGVIGGGLVGLLISWLFHKSQFKDLRQKILSLEDGRSQNIEVSPSVNVNPSINVTMTGADASRITGDGQAVEGIIGRFDANVVHFGTRYGPISVRLDSAEETQIDLVKWLQRNNLLAPLEDI